MTEDAPMVAALRACGALMIGKSAMTELATSPMGMNILQGVLLEHTAHPAPMQTTPGPAPAILQPVYLSHGTSAGVRMLGQSPRAWWGPVSSASAEHMRVKWSQVPHLLVSDRSAVDWLPKEPAQQLPPAWRVLFGHGSCRGCRPLPLWPGYVLWDLHHLWPWARVKSAALEQATPPVQQGSCCWTGSGSSKRQCSVGLGMEGSS